MDRMFRALADATRRDIVRRTLHAEATVSELAESYAMSFAAVQKHVAVLEEAGLVTKHPHGRQRIVRGNPDAIRRAQSLLDQFEAIWRSRVDRLDALLESDPPARPTERLAMPVTAVEKDLDALTLTIVADFAASPERVWEAYTDPRQLERFWGPPTYPATFTRHDVAPGGRSTYAMTGPEGDSHGGYWEWTAVEAPRSFEVVDGFLGDDGAPNTELPTVRMRFDFAGTAGGTRVTTTSFFGSLEQLEQLVAMGMEEGTKQAMAQIDDVLADLASFAAGRDAEAQILSDTQVRVSRIIRGSVEQVWRAHNDADLMRQWLLGPDGWTMPVCEVATSVGGSYRYEWEKEGGGDRFGFTGELLESEPPRRAVTTEAMIGLDAPATLNELTLTPRAGGTLLTLVITYANAEMRDAVLATGMVGGMETSYARLESVLASADAREPVAAH
ncbi:hypothetical protein GCM10025866_31180 [Naasia aerilata]|uniref:HTH arsR-type domain-containing protein n=1 Tax=Naasia aerilata TaxID=1162966 RepID=A0ABN6XQB7_9MICO|nr:hypothetical protein GCM10025866_31180 [Naasia aerilata]